MISMHSIPSSLILRHEFWVLKQASSLLRRVPSSVEKADLIQVGLIAVAQSAMLFKWNGDHDSVAGQDAFMRYASQRVKGAMLDELRQTDYLSRGERRKVKLIDVARERWRAAHGSNPTLADLSRICGMGINDISNCEQAAAAGQTVSLSEYTDDDRAALLRQPTTPADEVEVRVDTAVAMRRLARYMSGLPERERQVIDAYLGVTVSPTELARSLGLAPSRISQIYRVACERIVRHFGNPGHRAVDWGAANPGARGRVPVAHRVDELAHSGESVDRGLNSSRKLQMNRPGSSSQRGSGASHDPQRQAVGMMHCTRTIRRPAPTELPTSRSLHAQTDV